MNSLETGALNSALTQLAEACSPSQRDYQNRIHVISAVKEALQELVHYEKKDVLPYGSFVSGFYKASSDLDLAFVGFLHASSLRPRQLADITRAGHRIEEYMPLSVMDKGSKAELLRKCAELLRKRRVVKLHSVQYILHARVPIIKFKDATYGIDCDLCIGDERTPFKAAFVRQLSTVDDRFGPLFRVVKAWAKAHYINDGANSTFNSWCLTLIVAFYMQSDQMLPPIASLFYSDPHPRTPRLMCPGPSVDLGQALAVSASRVEGARREYQSRLREKTLIDLFVGFIEFMGKLLNTCLDGPHRCLRMCTWLGLLQERVAFAKQYVLLVEDPFDDNDNVARTFGTQEEPAFSLGFVCKVFDQTQEVLESALTGRTPVDSALAWLFGPSLLIEVPALVPHIFTVDQAQWVLQEAQRQPPRSAPQGSSPGFAIAAAAAAEVVASQETFQQLLEQLGCTHELMTIAKFKAIFLAQGRLQQQQPGRRPRWDRNGDDGLPLTPAEAEVKRRLAQEAKKERQKEKDRAKRIEREKRRAAAAEVAEAPPQALPVAGAAAAAALATMALPMKEQQHHVAPIHMANTEQHSSITSTDMQRQHEMPHGTSRRTQHQGAHAMSGQGEQQEANGQQHPAHTASQNKKQQHRVPKVPPSSEGQQVQPSHVAAVHKQQQQGVQGDPVALPRNGGHSSIIDGSAWHASSVPRAASRGTSSSSQQQRQPRQTDLTHAEQNGAGGAGSSSGGSSQRYAESAVAAADAALGKAHAQAPVNHTGQQRPSAADRQGSSRKDRHRRIKGSEVAAAWQASTAATAASVEAGAGLQRPTVDAVTSALSSLSTGGRVHETAPEGQEGLLLTSLSGPDGPGEAVTVHPGQKPARHFIERVPVVPAYGGSRKVKVKDGTTAAAVGEHRNIAGHE